MHLAWLSLLRFYQSKTLEIHFLSNIRNNQSMTKRFKPQYLPYNDTAHAVVETLAAKLSLTLNAATGAKHKAILER